MYQCHPSFVLGFHGCDKDVGESILSGKAQHKFSENDYDWLGRGIYFWENDPYRASEWAIEQKNRGKIKQEFVIGAVIDLKNCLNLLQRDALILLKDTYEKLIELQKDAKLKELPQNKPIDGEDTLIRRLDCAVIETIHLLNEAVEKPQYDTVRGVFFEGKELYPGAGFKEKNHIQICVRNRNCIKGYFLPRKKGADIYPDSVLPFFDQQKQ